MNRIETVTSEESYSKYLAAIHIKEKEFRLTVENMVKVKW